MRKRKWLPLLAVVLALLCLAGCAATDESDDTKPHEGVWYFAKNAAECRVGDGKVYRDDLHSKEGQALIGVYSEADDHIEANLSGVGGVQVTRMLCVAQTDEGEVLRDSTDGTVYFYRNAVAAMAALEAAEEPVPSEPAVRFTPDETDLPPAPSSEPVSDELSSDEPVSRVMPGLEEEPSHTPEPTAATASGGMVWIPQSGSKYHKISTCSGMKNPSQVSRSQAESRGYTPCKRCW